MTPTDDPRAEERARREAGDGPTAEQAARFAAARAAWQKALQKAAKDVEAKVDGIKVSLRLVPGKRAVRGAEETTTQRDDDLGEGVL